MHTGYEGLGIIWLIVLIAIIIVAICITIAPLIIWRNGNRTNRLLSLIALRLGVPSDKIRTAFYKGGGDLPSVVYEIERIKKSEEQ